MNPQLKNTGARCFCVKKFWEADLVFVDIQDVHFITKGKIVAIIDIYFSCAQHS